MIKIKYGNTNTFFVHGNKGGLLFDTDYAGTLPAFYKAIKQNNIAVKDIRYVLASHYHPDHMGLISELMKQGLKLIVADVQKDFLHDSDILFLYGTKFLICQLMKHWRLLSPAKKAEVSCPA